MMKNRAAWLALIVLAVASVLMVFFVMPRINHDSKPLGDAINAAGNAVKDAVTDQQQAAKPAASPAPTTAPATTPAPTAPVPAAPSQAAVPAPGQTATAKVPSFDVLRVEPDGSTVIAGRAEPNSTLEVTNGASIVAKANVGASGDFAAILDNPLPPGDHQLVLKVTGKDGKSTVSEETATISVPADKKSGKLLAMVTTPGKASRVLAMPSTGAESAATPAAQQAATPLPAAAPVAPANAESTIAGIPAMPAGSSSLTASAPNMGVTPSAAPVAITPAELQVTAVEIEGSKIFVAGVAKTGATLRGQADGKTIGTAQASQNGSFVIEGVMELSVGDHRIAVESLGSAGQVLMRVEVPFNRPAGDQVAVVAAPPNADMLAKIDAGAFDKLRNDAVRAFNLLRGLYEDGKTPTLEQLSAARSSTTIALKSLAEYRLPADAAQAARGVITSASEAAATAFAALDALPRDIAVVGKNLDKVGEMIAKAVGPALAQGIKGIAPQAVESASAASDNGTRTIQQAPLTQSERNSVIIRRGDTLWQISRRAYGQGVRYTTIYLANEDKIANPDIIQPGQIFGVPEDYRPDSEELHRQRMMHKRS